MLSREEHGELRAGRITSSVCGLLMAGTKRSWERLAQHLDDPPPFYAPNPDSENEGVRNMAAGAKNEPLIARRWLNKHPEIMSLEHPTFVQHHDRKHPFYDLIASSPDRLADGIPVEIKYANSVARFNKLAKPLANGFIPSEHRDQCDWHAWMTGKNRCWFVVATEKKIADVLYRNDNLGHIDTLLERFMSQYRQYNIVGIKG